MVNITNRFEFTLHRTCGQFPFDELGTLGIALWAAESLPIDYPVKQAFI